MTEVIRKLGSVCDTCVDRSDYSDIILNSITDGVVTIGLDWQIKYLNRAAREMLGAAEEDACGHNCRSVIGGHLCGSSCLLKRTMETGENITNYETQIKTRDGRLIPVSINTALLRDKDGKVVGGVEIFRDISLIKELKGELEKKYAFEQIVGKKGKIRIRKLMGLALTCDHRVVDGGPAARFLQDLCTLIESPDLIWL